MERAVFLPRPPKLAPRDLAQEPGWDLPWHGGEEDVGVPLPQRKGREDAAPAPLIKTLFFPL